MRFISALAAGAVMALGSSGVARADEIATVVVAQPVAPATMTRCVVHYVRVPVVVQSLQPQLA